MVSRIVGIIGGVLLIAGAWCPIAGFEVAVGDVSVSFMGIQTGDIATVHLDGLQRYNFASWEGIVLIICGIAALVLAALKQNRLLTIPGALSIAVLSYTFFTFKSKMVQGASGGSPMPDYVRREFEAGISLKWGWLVLLFGAIATIAAATLKGAPSAPQTDWGPPPPPPPSYRAA